jgi:hypothetical protein
LGRLKAALFFCALLFMIMRLVIKSPKRVPVPQHSFTDSSGMTGTVPYNLMGRDTSNNLTANNIRHGVAGLEDEGNLEVVNECGCACPICSADKHHPEDEYEEPETLEQDILAGLYSDPEAIFIVIEQEEIEQNILDEKKRKKKKGDRCVRIAKRKYNRWPSAYASGAVVKCRQGKIWKGLKESAEHVEYEIYETTLEEAAILLEKYKKIKQSSLRDWFSQNRGKGWIDCRTGKPCGRKKAGRGARRKYPACRPTKAHCNKTGTRRKRGKAAISWKPKKDK